MNGSSINPMVQGQAGHSLVSKSNPLGISALQQILDTLANCHQAATDIHSIADRACGMIGDSVGAAPQAVPNGLLEEVLQSVSALNDRLNGATARLSRVA